MKNILIRFQVDDNLTDRQFLNSLRNVRHEKYLTGIVTEKQVVGGGYHRPVCAKCKCEMRPERNGTGVLDMAEFGPYAVWDTDLWKCPECGIEVIGGFASGPISQHWQDDFEKMVDHYRKAGMSVRVPRRYGQNRV